MSPLRRLELMDRCPFFYPAHSSLFLAETLAPPPLIDNVYEDVYLHGLDLVLPPEPYPPLDILDAVSDLYQMETSLPFYRGSLYRGAHRRTTSVAADPFLLSLLDRVSALEHSFERVLGGGRRAIKGERKFEWTAEIEGKHVDRKHKWKAEISPRKEKRGESFKWVAQVKEKVEGGERTYTWTESYDDEEKKHKKDKEKKKGKKDKGAEFGTRIVEIEEPTDRRAVMLRQAFARRAGAIRNARGKKKELSPQDAAAAIQMSFREYLIRRSQTFHALRELAVAKTKLREIRALFNNISYRRRVSHDAEERQRFSEKIIVLLLTVDAIEGVNLMVRAAKKTMVDELEAILDAVDPQPAGRSLSMRRRTFDVPDGVIKKEIADGVAQIVRMLDQEERSTTASEA